jgi:tetratricopeptide (TPR) repeat protein
MNNKKNYISKLVRILTYDELLEYSNDEDSLVDIGYNSLELGDFRKAFKIFSAAVRLNGGDDPDGLNGLGVALCELGRLKSSKAVLEKTVELYPDDAITLANIAGLYWEESDSGKAIHYYYKSLEMDAGIPETHLNLINLYYEQGHLFMAYIACLNLLKIYPDNEQAKEIIDDLIIDMGLMV